MESPPATSPGSVPAAAKCLTDANRLGAAIADHVGVAGAIARLQRELVLLGVAENSL
jgi:hypothetical protein